MAGKVVRIEFLKGQSRRYGSVLHRSDGVDVAFEGGSYNKVGPRAEVPHDLAHLIVEDELRLQHGVWGVLVRGGLFKHATVVAGRQAPHAARRGREVIAQAGDRIMQAEILTRAVCDACAGELPANPPALERAVGSRWWSDAVTSTALDRAGVRLRAAAKRWAQLAPDSTLEETWPVDTETARARRGSHGRAGQPRA